MASAREDTSDLGLSYPRNKLKILLLEGIHENAVKHLARAGYTAVTRLPHALSGEELSRALAAFGEALAIARRFSPKDNEWLRRQATLLEKTGAIMSQSGNKTEAAGRFEESLAIRRKLVESEPDNLQWQIDLAFGLRTAANATGDFDESLRRLGEARDIIERLDSEGRLSAGQESWLTSIQSEMSRIDAARLVAPARK